MSYALLRSTKNPKILLWLADGLEKRMPNLELEGLDKSVLVYAYQDLQTCLSIGLEASNRYQLHMKLRRAVERSPDEVKAFLEVWAGQWVEKWRKRVTVSQGVQKVSRRRFGFLRRALKLYRVMKERKKLEELVVQRLVRRGEVCRPKQIAENLIIKEIAAQLGKCQGKNLMCVSLNMLKVLHGVYARIEKLAESKTPLLHLKIIRKRWTA
jgi:hypothetical protein